MTARRCRGDAGQVAGIEAVPFGLLVLLVGVLLVAHTWAVVDARFRATVAAREATRAYVESTGGTPGLEAAQRAAAVEPAATIDGPTTARRCATAGFRATIDVPAIGVPWRGDRPHVRVRAQHREVVDPYRDGLAGTADCELDP